jgi:hypothetical protein
MLILSWPIKGGNLLRLLLLLHCQQLLQASPCGRFVQPPVAKVILLCLGNLHHKMGRMSSAASRSSTLARIQY